MKTTRGQSQDVIQPRASMQFKTIAFTDAATTVLTSPPAGAAIVVVDVLVSTEKLNGGSVTVRFADETNVVNIFSAIVTDAPVNLAFSPAGRWRGWRGARLEIVSVGPNIDGTVSAGYYFIRGSSVLSFDDWDTERGPS